MFWAPGVQAPRTTGPMRLAFADQSLTGPPPEPFPTLNSPQFDRQLELYLRYLAENGRPDVLVVGSSRSLQGVDPLVLQEELRSAGYAGVKVFNLGMNGATAQVVEVLLRWVLRPEQLPRVIVWGDGSRAFNSGRRDRTYERLVASPGFERLQAGERPVLVPYVQGNLLPDDPRSVLGLNIVESSFVPEQYFQKYARIAGRFDGDYYRFNLGGEQAAAVDRVLAYTKQQRVPVVFVNLPLTDIYIDPVRRDYERQFKRYQQKLSERGVLTFVDLGDSWADRYDYFVDPSHLNEKGAKAVAAALGERLASYLEQRVGLRRTIAARP
jgi:hypothetical protein